MILRMKTVSVGSLQAVLFQIFSIVMSYEWLVIEIEVELFCLVGYILLLQTPFQLPFLLSDNQRM